MRALLATVAALASVLAVSACGSSEHTVFTAFSKVRSLSVPTPAGFHSRTWPGGVVISDRSGKIPIPVDAGAGLAGYPNQAELAVYETVFLEPAPVLKFPLTLQSLRQAGDGLREWSGVGSVGGTGSYVVEVWLGPKAPAADRSAILSALHSITPR